MHDMYTGTSLYLCVHGIMIVFMIFTRTHACVYDIHMKFYLLLLFISILTWAHACIYDMYMDIFLHLYVHGEHIPIPMAVYNPL